MLALFIGIEIFNYPLLNSKSRNPPAIVRRVSCETSQQLPDFSAPQRLQPTKEAYTPQDRVIGYPPYPADRVWQFFERYCIAPSISTSAVNDDAARPWEDGQERQMMLAVNPHDSPHPAY